MNLKKLFVTCSLLVATTFTYSPKSHAIVALASWNPPLMGAGLLLHVVGGTAALGLAGAERAFKSKNYFVKGLGVISGAIGVVGVGVMTIGIIVLPDGSVELQYAPIDEELKKKVSLTQAEVDSFNSELDQVNFITNQVAIDLSHKNEPTAEDAKEVWAKYTHLVSPETLSALTKVTATMFEK